MDMSGQWKQEVEGISQRKQTKQRRGLMLNFTEGTFKSKHRKHVYVTDVEQLLSAAKVSVQMQKKGVLVIFVSDWGSQDSMWECSGKHESLQLGNNPVNSKKPILLQRRILNMSL